MQQFCSIFAVWVQILLPYTLWKWKQIIEKSFCTGPCNLPLVSELSTMVTFKPLKQARENGAILLYFRCLSPNFTTFYLMKMKANHWEQFLDMTL